jgi:diguanylate cyclase (GGDEF)-like protein
VNEPKTVILVADDEESMGMMLEEALHTSGYDVIRASNGLEAFQMVQAKTPDLILLDVQMPVMDGFTVCQKLKSDLLLRHIPVMMLTAQSGVSSKVTGLERGADDYITKPFDLQELIARIRTLLRRTRQGLEANPLTRLPGNITIENEILARLEANQPFAVLYLDLNSFKAYNDTYGFIKGDEVIRETAKIILKEADKDRGFVGHIGGDDFIVLTDPETCEALAQRVIARFDEIAPKFYTDSDQKRGYVETTDRRGQLARFALLSIAIGVVTNQYRSLSSLGEVSSIGTEMKHFAKEKKDKGSSYAVDRRTEKRPS